MSPKGPPKHRRAVYYERLAAANRTHSPVSTATTPTAPQQHQQIDVSSSLCALSSSHGPTPLQAGSTRLSIPSRQTQCLAPTGLIQSPRVCPVSVNNALFETPLSQGSKGHLRLGRKERTTQHPRRLLLHPARHPALSPFTGSGLLLFWCPVVSCRRPPRPGPARLIDWSTTYDWRRPARPTANPRAACFPPRMVRVRRPTATSGRACGSCFLCY